MVTWSVFLYVRTGDTPNISIVQKWILLHNCELWIINSCWIPGVGTHILGHCTWWWPPFMRFSIRLGPYFMSCHDPSSRFFLQKNRFVSITFSSRNLKLVYFFTKMYYLTDFKHFVSTFSPWFSIQLTLFLIDFKSFLTPHFHKTLEPIGPNIFACWTWLLKIWWNSHPGLNYATYIHYTLSHLRTLRTQNSETDLFDL